jgi:hypothetical protein
MVNQSSAGPLKINGKNFFCAAASMSLNVNQLPK